MRIRASSRCKAISSQSDHTFGRSHPLFEEPGRPRASGPDELRRLDSFPLSGSMRESPSKGRPKSRILISTPCRAV